MANGFTFYAPTGNNQPPAMSLKAALESPRRDTNRVVLPPAAAIDLINRMQQIAAALTQAGVAKIAKPAAQPPKSTS